MPTLNWIGKDKVVNHHQEVPFRVLEHKYGFTEKGEQPSKTNSGNQIIQGDNLEALKSLLPEYEGKINCIYIDPPYNTGNESWVYNDNVNHPKIKQWLGEVVGKEGDDLSRHDKWLCMMYPRLRLLKKLLASTGYIGISIDDNELANLVSLMNDMFGSKNKVAICPWKSEPSGGKGKGVLRVGHEYLVIYSAGNRSEFQYEEKVVDGEIRTDKFGNYVKGRELSKWGSESLRSDREDMFFSITNPDGKPVYPIRNDGVEGRWRWGKNNPIMQKILKDKEHAHWEIRSYDEGVEVDGKNERWFPYEKIRETSKYNGWSSWLDNVGSNSEGTKIIKSIFESKIFDTPKPTTLIEYLINLSSDDNAIVLDSFSGSGTTAHAVLNLNKQDGGNRKFILVEMEDYTNDITAERVKRVINGYGKDEKAVEGTGGQFDFYELGKPIFKKDQNLNEEVGEDKIRNYIFYSETKQPLNREHSKDAKYLLDNYQDTGYYFYYEKNSLTTLDLDALDIVKEKQEQYIIYADICLLDPEYMLNKNIIFKKIPRDIKRF